MSKCRLTPNSFFSFSVKELGLENFETIFSKNSILIEDISTQDIEVLRKKIDSINDSYSQNQLHRPYTLSVKEGEVEIFVETSPKLLSEVQKQVEFNLLEEGFSLGSFQETSAKHPEKRPVTDSFKELLEFKAEMLGDRWRRLKEINKSLNKALKEENRLILEEEKKKLQVDINTLTTQIKKLESTGSKGVYHGIYSELELISEILKSKNSSSSERVKVKERLNTVHILLRGKDIAGRQMDIEGFNTSEEENTGELETMLDSLILSYEEKVVSWATETVEENTIYNIYKDIDPNIEIEKLMESGKDINWLNKNFLGINSNTTKESIVPSTIYSILQENTLDNFSQLKDIKERLIKAAEVLNKDLTFLKEKDSSFEDTGRMVNIYSDEWNKTLSKHISKMRYLTAQVRKAKNPTQLSIAKQVRLKADFDFYQKNTNIIQPALLPEVKELFGEVSPEHFTHTEEEMRKYQENLKNTLGATYKNQIEKVIQRLKQYQESVAENGKTPETEASSPWLVSRHMQGGVSPVMYSEIDGKKVALLYDSRYIVSFPKKKILNKQKQKVDSGYYNKAFQDLTPEQKEVWSIMAEALDFISDTYSDPEITSMTLPVFTKELGEVLADTSGLEKLTVAGKSIISDFKGWFYESGLKKDRRGLVNNYNNNTKAQVRSLIETYSLLPDKQVKKILKEEGMLQQSLAYGHNIAQKEKILKTLANKQVFEDKSNDILQSTLGLLNLAATQKARQDTYDTAQLLLEAHKINDPGRERSIEKIEQYIDRVIVGNMEKYRGGEEKVLNASVEKTQVKKLVLFLSKQPIIQNFINENSLKKLNKVEKELAKIYIQSRDNKSGKEDIFLKGDEEGEEIKYLYDAEKKKYIKKITDTNVENAGDAEVTFGENGFTYSQIGVTEEEITEEEYKKVRTEFYQKKIDSMGVEMTLAGIITGMLKLHVVKSLVFKPIGGVINRMEGKNTTYIMDISGQYWTEGNAVVAHNMMAFANFKHISGYTEKQKEGVNAMAIFQAFLDNTNIIQDRKTELDKLDKNSRYQFKKWFNPYGMTVDRPEFKNQGAVILSVLMDVKITDEEGVEHPFIDKKTGTFTLYELKDGILKVKEGFRTEENIMDWENFISDSKVNPKQKFFKSFLKATQAVARVQGNYDEKDVIGATKSIWGRVAMLFRKYLPEQFAQRVSNGEGFDWATTTGQKREGRYRTVLKHDYIAAPAGALALGTVLGLSIPAIIGGAVVGKYVIKQFVKKMYPTENINSEVYQAMDTIRFLQSFLIETANYPLGMLNLKARIANNSFKSSPMSQEQIGNIKAVTRELAMVFSWLALAILAGKAMLPDDDEEETPDQKRQRYFVDNQMTRMVKSFSVYYDPVTVFDEATRIALISDLGTAQEVLKAIGDGNRKNNLLENSLKLTPLPTVFANVFSPTEGSLIQDKKEFSPSDWWDRTIKGAENAAKNDYNLEMRELRDEYTKEELQDLEVYKQEGESYEEALERIKNFD